MTALADLGSNWNIKVFEHVSHTLRVLHEEDIVEVSFPLEKIIGALRSHFVNVRVVDTDRRRPTWKSERLFIIAKETHLGLVAGRIFSQGEWGMNLALVSEKTTKILWPGKDPIGHQFNLGDPATEKPFTVIGIVRNARTVSLAKPDPMLIYVPYWYRTEREAGLIVRTRQEPSHMLNAIRETVWSVDGTVPVPEVRALAGVITDSVANQRFEMYLMLLFATSALFLAGLGVYGVVTYSVVQRNREIGLRMALGARRGTVYRLVMWEGLLPVAMGALAGVGLAFASMRLVRTLLFQVSPYDPVLAAGAICVLLTAGIVGCMLPARRAASVDPMQTLRTE